MDFQQKSAVKLVFAGLLGNILEWYDFGVYVYLAPILAGVFFPSKSPFSSLLGVFVVFAVSFLLRPFSAILFGYLGDKIGRKKTLVISSSLLALSTFSIGLLPTYASIGALSGVLLAFLRLVQGFAMGGEVGFSIYMVEHAPFTKRGLYGCIPVFTCIAGYLLSSVTVNILNSLLTKQALFSWGWRLPFLFGILLGSATLYFRLYMPETPYFSKIKVYNQIIRNPFSHALIFEWRAMIKACMLTFLSFATFGVLFIYLPSYLNVYLQIPFEQALWINTTSIVLMLITTPFVGYLSDKFGRKTMFLIASLFFVIFSYPLFYLLHTHSSIVLLAVEITFAIFVSFAYAPLMVTLVEIFPTPIRYTAIAFPFNLVSALFGGTTPLIVSYLIKITHDKMAPSFYLIAAGIVTLILLPFVPETYKRSLSSIPSSTERVHFRVNF